MTFDKGVIWEIVVKVDLLLKLERWHEPLESVWKRLGAPAPPLQTRIPLPPNPLLQTPIIIGPVSFDKVFLGIDSVEKDGTPRRGVRPRLCELLRRSQNQPRLLLILDAHGLGEPTPQQVFDAVVAIRRARLPDPAREPNAGSFFKNPVLEAAQAQALQARFAGLPGYPQDDGRVKLPAAWLIEHCGFKGRRRGAVRVHREHALVLVNDGAGRGEELLALAREIAAQVADTFAIELEIEPRVYGAAA